MNTRNKWYKWILTGAVCTIGLPACSHLRMPSDAQLTALLRDDKALAGGTTAPLDSSAIECLRAWSADQELTRGLPVNVAGEDGKKACRSRLETRLADSTRNPDGLRFEEFSAPNAVRRAMELQTQKRTPATADAAKAQRARAPAAVDAPVDLGAAGAKLDEADNVCSQAQQVAQTAAASEQVKNFAGACGANLRMLRTYITRAARNGQNGPQLDSFATSAQRIADNGKKALGAAQQ